ncbi:MAG: RIP metalloprotease RseP [Bacilli bacterium]
MEIIKFLVIIVSLVTVHELGHFLAAKFFNVYVSEFALGFGPKIFSYQGKETLFSIRALPLGGYAAMVGEEGPINEDELDIPYERTLNGVNRFKQFIIMVAGCVMNFLLALFIMIGIYASQDVPNPQPVIGSVVTDMPAAKAGLQANDEIISIIYEDKTIPITEFKDIVAFNKTNTTGESYVFEVKRDDKVIEIPITPVYVEDSKTYLSGFSQQLVKNNNTIVQSISKGFNATISLGSSILDGLKSLVTGKVGLDQMSGPVGILQITKDIDDQYGLIGLLNFTAMLSINLAIFNLLPIPALDGGRILIILVESITQRKLNEKFQQRIITISFILLMGLIIFVTFNDILKIFAK